MKLLHHIYLKSQFIYPKSIQDLYRTLHNQNLYSNSTDNENVYKFACQSSSGTRPIQFHLVGLPNLLLPPSAVLTFLFISDARPVIAIGDLSTVCKTFVTLHRTYQFEMFPIKTLSIVSFPGRSAWLFVGWSIQHPMRACSIPMGAIWCR